jgi:hypothetical protein
MPIAWSRRDNSNKQLPFCTLRRLLDSGEESAIHQIVQKLQSIAFNLQTPLFTLADGQKSWKGQRGKLVAAKNREKLVSAI